LHRFDAVCIQAAVANSLNQGSRSLAALSGVTDDPTIREDSYTRAGAGIFGDRGFP